MRRIVTARQQVEMLAPWRLAAEEVSPSIHDLVPGHVTEGNGRWVYRHKKTEDGSYPRHEYGIHPASSPASHTYTDDRGKTHTMHYDPALTGGQEPQPGRWGHEWPDQRALWNKISDLQPPSGMLWRGMSREEYEEARDKGYFESKGDHNIGDFQKGLSFYSTDPEQASSYATWFAPTAFKPTFTHPGYVVGIPDRPRLPRGADPTRPDPTSTEVGVPGRVPFSEVTHTYVGRPSSLAAGEQGVAMGWNGWEAGGSNLPTANIIWQPHQPEILPTRKLANTGMWHTAGAGGPLPQNLTFRHHPDGFDPFPEINPDDPVPPPGHKWVQFHEDLDYDEDEDDNEVPFYLAAPDRDLWHVRGADSGFRYSDDELKIHDRLPPGVRPNMSIDDWPTVSAHDGDRLAGYLQWFPKENRDSHGEIRNIHVLPQYRRRGIGTALFDYVKTNYEPLLHHSENRSRDGDAWSSYEQSRHREAAVDPAQYGIDPEDYRFRHELGKWRPKVDDDGMVDLYHRTSPKRADSIVAHGFNPSLTGDPCHHSNDEVFFTTTPHGNQKNRYGDAVVHVRVPVGDVNFDTVWGEDSEEAWATVYAPDLKGLSIRRLAGQYGNLKRR